MTLLNLSHALRRDCGCVSNATRAAVAPSQKWQIGRAVRRFISMFEVEGLSLPACPGRASRPRFREMQLAAIGRQLSSCPGVCSCCTPSMSDLSNKNRVANPPSPRQPASLPPHCAGFTPLHLACQMGHWHLLPCLVRGTQSRCRKAPSRKRSSGALNHPPSGSIVPTPLQQLRNFLGLDHF